VGKKKDLPAQTAPPRVSKGGGTLGLRKMLNGLAGAKLCYGEPVRNGDHVVIPVARVRAAGGGGIGEGGGHNPQDGSTGGGSGKGVGGQLDAAPVGFIDIGPDGAQFHSIPDPITNARALTTAVATLIGAVWGLRALRAGNRRALPAAARLLRRGQ
jgi:uncharacterized spore protein YtfJ